MPAARLPVVLLLLLGLVAGTVLRTPLLDLPLERDEGAYAVVATEMLRGAVPYRDVWDHKPPGVYVAYAAACVGEVFIERRQCELTKLIIGDTHTGDYHSDSIVIVGQHVAILDEAELQTSRPGNRVECHPPICSSLLNGGRHSMMGAGLMEVPVWPVSRQHPVDQNACSASGIAIDHPARAFTKNRREGLNVGIGQLTIVLAEDDALPAPVSRE